jgi:hypothetical protein
VFKDPDGNNCEIYCDIIQVTDDNPHTPQVWERNIDAFDQWRFKRFVVPPPHQVIKDKEGQ